MNRKSSRWKFMAALALLASGAACTGQSDGLPGAAVPQASDTAAEQPATPAPGEEQAEEGAAQPAADTGAAQPVADSDADAEQPATDSAEQQAEADAVAEQLAAEAAAEPVVVDGAAESPAIDAAGEQPAADASAEQPAADPDAIAVLRPLACPGNLIANGNFATAPVVVGNGSMPPSTVTGWLRAFGTPQLSSALGHGNNGFVYMWGNRVVGEGIQQTIAPLVASAQYRLSASVSWVNSAASPLLPAFVRFKVRASAAPLTSYTAGPASMTIGTIGLTPGSVPPPVAPGITSTTWMNVTLPAWTAPAAGLNTITINPENLSSVNSGAQVSWGKIDNVCLRRVPLPCVLDPGMVAAGNTFARRIVLAQTFTPTQSGSLTKITHGLQNISTVPTYDLLITTTAPSGEPAWAGGAYTGLPVLYQAKDQNIKASDAKVNAAIDIPPGAVKLTAGTKYALVLIPGPGPGYMAWRGNTSAASYANGSAYELVGTTWKVPTTGPKDHGFKLDGECP